MLSVPPELVRALRSANRIALSAHVRPDGDAIGSTVALADALRASGKTVIALNEDGIPGHLSFLDPNGLVQISSGPVEVDLAVILDTSTKERAGELTLAAIAGAPVSWAVDHHISNQNFCRHNWVEAEAAATGSMVYAIIREAGLPLTNVARDALFVAISTDTGSFQYPNTTAETFRIAADLVEAGAACGALNQKIQTYPFRRIQALDALMRTLEMSDNNRVASWTLDLATKEALQLEVGDTEGLSDLLRGIDSVVATVFFDEIGVDEVRVSCRSKDNRLSVADVCARLGGGGHRLAAGVRIRRPLSEARRLFLSILHEELEPLS